MEERKVKRRVSMVRKQRVAAKSLRALFQKNKKNKVLSARLQTVPLD